MLPGPVALALLATSSRSPLRPDAHASCRAKAAPTMGFGLTDREAARLSQMKRTDEPLEEEVRGLYIVGATGGLVLGPLLFGSSILGMIVGVQVGPSLAFTGGERMRATGWESWRLWGIQVRRSRRAWLIARREAEARGLTPLLRCSYVENSRPEASAGLPSSFDTPPPAPDQPHSGLQPRPASTNRQPQLIGSLN